MARVSLALALFVSACASAQPAPIAYGDSPPPPVRETPAARAAPDWAAAAGTPLSAYALRPEDVQHFDPAHPPRTHRIGANESLYDIATRYQVPLLALIGQNGLEPPYALTPGRELRLPPPRFHIAADGESFEDIARHYNIDTRSLALLNRLTLPHEVRPGERIVLPAMVRADDGPPAPSSPAAGVETPAFHGARFAWPLRGRIVARFGAQVGGGRLDGVEIAGREGARVVSAAEGDVVYAGADLPAYGTLVLVRHGDDYVTAYGYGRRALVREGQHVRAGEALAELGSRPGGARLLFQVRRGRDAIDPLALLGSP